MSPMIDIEQVEQVLGYPVLPWQRRIIEQLNQWPAKTHAHVYTGRRYGVSSFLLALDECAR